MKLVDTEGKGTLETEEFFSSMADIGIPLSALSEDGKTKLLAIYDKKGEGRFPYQDFLDEHKYIHAVSHFPGGRVGPMVLLSFFILSAI